MEIKLKLEGPEAGEESLLAIQDWLRRSDIEGLRVEREKSRPAEGEMGDVSTILSVVLGSAAVVELVRTIRAWVGTRRRNVKIKLDVRGTKVEIEAENLSDDEAVNRTAERLIKAAKG